MKLGFFLSFFVGSASLVQSLVQCRQNTCFTQLQSDHGINQVIALCGPLLDLQSSAVSLPGGSGTQPAAFNACSSSWAEVSSICACAQEASLGLLDDYEPAKPKARRLQDASFGTHLSRRLAGSLKAVQTKDDRKLEFQYSTDSPNDYNVIRLYRVGSPEDEPVASVAALSANGHAIIDASSLYPGNFTAYYYFNDGQYTLAGPVSVEIAFSKLKRQKIGQKGIYQFAYRTNRPDSYNRISVYKQGATDVAAVTYEYATGEVDVVGLTETLYPGSYVAYLTGYYGLSQQLSQGVPFTVEEGILALDKSRVRYTFRYTTEFSSDTNWIGIYPAGDPAKTSFVRDAWKWAPGAAGQLTIEVQLPPGDYVAYFTRKAGVSSKLADGYPFTVENGQLQYQSSQAPFSFYYETTSPHDGNYIGIFDTANTRAPGSGVLKTVYAPGTSGVVTVNSPNLTPDKTYRAFFLKASETRTYGKDFLAESVTFRVPLSRLAFIENATLATFDYDIVTPDSYNWIGLFEADDSKAPGNGNYKAYAWAPGRTGTNQISVFDVKPGKYNAYLLANNGNTPISSAVPVTIPENTVAYSPCKSAWTIEYTTTKPLDNNWVGIYSANYQGELAKEWVAWKPAPGGKGQAYFNLIDPKQPVSPGNYTLYYFANNGYTPLAGPVQATLSLELLNSPTCRRRKE